MQGMKHAFSEEKSRGFSLIESLIIISIVGMVTTMSLQAFPAIRAHQQLIADTEQIRSLLLDSKQRALNQVRPEDCMPDVPVESKDRAACSDVGIAFINNEIIQFADTVGENHDYDPSDYVIVKFPLVTKLEGATNSLLFASLPPSVMLHVNGVAMAPEESANIKLSASDGKERMLTIRPFGTIDIL